MFLLQLGVIIVQLSQDTDSKKSSHNHKDQDPVLGLVCVLIACVFSGFAGIYFEKVLKGSNTNLWVLNIQLAIFSIIFGTIPLFQDYDAIKTYGFFQGYNWWAWGAVTMQACGGLIVALVVKFADNILKGYASSIAIILSSVLSAVLLKFLVTPLFVLGASLVVVSVYMYAKVSWR